MLKVRKSLVISNILLTFALRKQQQPIKAFVKRYNLALYTMKLMTKQIEKALDLTQRKMLTSMRQRTYEIEYS